METYFATLDVNQLVWLELLFRYSMFIIITLSVNVLRVSCRLYINA